MSVIPFDSAQSLDSPHVIHEKLLQIEHDLAVRQNSYEHVAGAWYRAQREIKKAWATALLSSTASSVTEKKAEADLAAQVVDGAEHEAEYEATKAALRVLEQRSMICMALLKSQGRV